MKRRFEFVEGKSSKFWEIEHSGSSFTTWYGRIGSDGQSTTKDFATPEKAELEAEKLVAEKAKKGYVEVGGSKPKEKKAKAEAPAKKAKAKAKVSPRPAPAEPAAPPPGEGLRFEFVEGSSKKFWEIDLDGAEVTTRWGRIGTGGQSKTKDYGKPQAAKREYEKLLAEKTEKGYVLVRGELPRDPTKQPSNPELEEALFENPGDEDAWLVYADWLQSQGDPRGELVVLHHKLAKAKGAEATKLKKREAQILAADPERFLPASLGKVLAKQWEVENWWAGKIPRFSDKADIRSTNRPEGVNLDFGGDSRTILSWRNGFLRTAFLVRASDWDAGGDGDETPRLEELVSALLAHPSSRFLEELSIGGLGTTDPDRSGMLFNYEKTVRAIAGAARPCLRKLHVAIIDSQECELSWSTLGDVGPLYAALPRLEVLRLQAGDMSLGKIDLPRLESFSVVTGGLAKESVRSIASAKWPELESLEIYFGDENYGGNASVKDIAPILEGKGLPKLTHLGLMNSMFADDIAKRLPASPIAKRVKSIDLSLGAMTDAGARHLAAGAGALRHLEELDVSDNYLSPEAEEILEALGKVVVGVDDQDKFDDYDPEDDCRYTTVGE